MTEKKLNKKEIYRNSGPCEERKETLHKLQTHWPKIRREEIRWQFSIPRRRRNNEKRGGTTLKNEEVRIALLREITAFFLENPCRPSVKLLGLLRIQQTGQLLFFISKQLWRWHEGKRESIYPTLSYTGLNLIKCPCAVDSVVNIEGLTSWGEPQLQQFLNNSPSRAWVKTTCLSNSKITVPPTCQN